jgi:hypothetical protein
MKKLAKIVSLMAAAILLVSTVAVLTPRVVRAVTATLVQSVDNPPRNAWTGSCVMSSTPENINSCSIVPPAGQVVTIQTISFQGTAINKAHIVLLLQTQLNNQEAYWYGQIDNVVTSPYGASPAGVTQFASSAALTLYSNPPTVQTGYGSDIYIYLATNGLNSPMVDGYGLGGTVTLVGYTVNVAPATSD